MKASRSLLAIVLSPLLAACAAVPRLPVAEPNAAVPAVVYRPGLDAAAAESAEASLDWRVANETMRRLGGHVGHVDPGAEPAGAAHKH